MTAYSLYADRTPVLMSNKSRVAILLVVLAVHAVLVPLPWLLSMRRPQVKENMFRVKLGGDTPRTAPHLGPAEQVRSNAGPKSSPPPEPPAPQVKQPPRPPVEPPVPKVKPPPRPPVEPPVPRVKRLPRQTKVPPKPTPRPPVEPPVPRVKQPPRQQPKIKGTRQNVKSNQQPSRSRPDTRSTGRTGGSTRHTAGVPIGSRDAGQRLGPSNHQTPQGGLTAAEEKYYDQLKKFLDFKWSQPPDSLLGGQRPQATIELEISADGRVLSSKIVKLSGNNSMDESVRRLLKVLDRVPAPPNGAMKIHVNMVVK